MIILMGKTTIKSGQNCPKCCMWWATVPGKDCLINIAGFIAKKHSASSPEVGTKTTDLRNDASSPWVMWASKGGLTVASEDFHHACCQFEASFQSFHNKHKNSIDPNCDVISTMSQVLQKEFSDWPVEILQFFAKTRTFIRIKYLNNCLKVDEAKAKLRSLKQSGQFQF